MKSLLYVLATKRLTRLVVEDEITRPIRESVEENYWLNYLVNCKKCTSVWAAAAVLILGHVLPGKFIICTLGISEAVLLADELLSKTSDDPLWS
ncbi:hypothetical protein PP304_gp064 [Gordonia phage Phendrix]|uniref:DUF1360 domain-containing protein n=1 Tax=Gordonia phage Phendrix TaxID=2593335 RepID=A0A514U0Z1_9CAUD|nr:hypothetical protein PP304_gp064 [Gordonia phage Phendrix]QDK02612.1 hypothetical protein SEA_PHENDRIX_64 [Gordonia phage Phendrix]